MWIFIWIILSSILLGATFWSLSILFKQKKAWETFASGKKLTFRRGTFMGPAEMNGVIGDYKLSFFTAERPGQDIRTRRYVSVMEIQLIEGLIDGGVAGTKEMLGFMQSIAPLHPYKVNHPSWEEGTFAFVRNDAAMDAYLTPDRAEALTQILKTKNADIIFIFNDREVVIRTETSDPMADAQKIDKITKRLMALCDRMRISPEERGRFAAMAQAQPQQVQPQQIQPQPQQDAQTQTAAIEPPPSAS